MLSESLVIGIIDDDEIYQFALSRIISKNKLAKEIHSFADGEKAIQFLVSNLQSPEKIPDVIFLDINMPILDGWQFIEEYEKLEVLINKKIPIFMLSSSIIEADIERAKKTKQISDYIIKSTTTFQDLKLILENLDKY